MLSINSLPRVFNPLLILLGCLPLILHADWDGPRVLQHQQGQLQLDTQPQRIVSFDLATLDTLDALDIEVAGVPGELIPEPLAKYRDDRYTSVGSLFEPDFESLAALQPDLIIVGGRAAPAYRQLNRLAPTLDLTHDYANFIEDLQKNSRLLGSLFGQEEAVETHLKQLQERIEATRELGEQAGTGLVILTSGGRISAYGPGSRTGWIHDELGIQPISSALQPSNHGDPISFEFLLQANPDYLFVLDRDTAIQSGSGSARALLDNDLVKQMKAYQKDQIVYLDSVTWYTLVSGLNATLRMVEEIHAALSQ